MVPSTATMRAGVASHERSFGAPSGPNKLRTTGSTHRAAPPHIDSPPSEESEWLLRLQQVKGTLEEEEREWRESLQKVKAAIELDEAREWRERMEQVKAALGREEEREWQECLARARAKVPSASMAPAKGKVTPPPLPSGPRGHAPHAPLEPPHAMSAPAPLDDKRPTKGLAVRLWNRVRNIAASW